MKRLAIIDDRRSKGFTFWLANLIFSFESEYFSTGDEVAKILNDRSPNFVLLYLRRPVNEDELMNMLSNFDDDIRLRVTFFEAGTVKSSLFRLFFPFDFLDSLYHFFFNPKTVKE